MCIILHNIKYGSEKLGHIIKISLKTVSLATFQKLTQRFRSKDLLATKNSTLIPVVSHVDRKKREGKGETQSSMKRRDH
jgi:hypothetical protein